MKKIIELLKKELLKEKLNEELNKDLNNELITACRRGNLDKVKDITYSNDKININNDYNGLYPLNHACFNGQLKIVKFLINQDKYNIDVNLQNSNRHTPLIIASLNGYYEIVVFLLYQNKYNVDINIKSASGNTALDIAKLFGRRKVVRTIENYIIFMKELQSLVFTFNNNNILPYEMVDMIIKIRKRIERNCQIPSGI